MAWIQIVNIPHWTVQDVQEWMKGLDDDLQCYRGTFEDNHVGGKKLLSLQAEDLEDLQINKIGHQELLLEAIGLLHDLNFNLPTDTLQSVTLSLSCGAKHLHSVVAKRQRERESYNVEPSICSDGLASDILMFVTHVITSARLLISWLDRLPFSVSSEYNAVRQKVLEHVMKLNSFSQLTGDAAIVERAILTTSKELLVLSEDFIRNACDPLIIQPAYVEVVTLRKSSADVELGLYIKTSTLDGIHYITDTKIGSPAHINEKIQPGDEVLQINKQTVVGWNHNKLIGALKADKSGVVLTLKKRPCNLKTPGHVINSHRWAGKSQPSSGSGKPHIKIKPSYRRKLVKQGSDSVDDELEESPQQQNNGQARKPRKCIEKDGNPPVIKDHTENNELQTKEVSQAIRDPDGAYTQVDKTNLDTKNEDRATNSTPSEMSTKLDNTQQDEERKEMESSTEKDANPTDDPLDSQSCSDPGNEEKIIGSEGPQIHVFEPSLNNQEEDVEASDLSDATSLGGESLDRDRPSYKKSDTLSISSTSSRGSQVKLRQKKGSGRSRKDRHVSCVDLGPGQYEGWLEKKTDTRFGTKWSRVWCVLKDFVFYYYKSKKDL
ncbi:connector enhancer of kinase suppressor of ras 2-like, partial [Anneissia japonica]|uniref:connector enhancer of kinase suppressor of ras 2-like n=1 Tax=Anneissia japonica TaxID=1529436 RepID=UPI0014254CC3